AHARRTSRSHVTPSTATSGSPARSTSAEAHLMIQFQPGINRINTVESPELSACSHAVRRRNNVKQSGMLARSRTACALCHRTDPLCDSHVIPEFIYKPLYNNEHRMVGWRATEAGLKHEYVQKGLREQLLCATCEGLLNQKYEQPS